MVHLLTPAQGGALLTIRVTPKASRARLGAAATVAAGRPVLKAWVTAPPADGAANRALIELVSGALDLPKCDVEIRRGHSDRTKTLFIEGDAGELAQRLKKALG
ncbi:MAG: DUF167 domain-containing protein [Alphaproteobacteria bacterium]|nr:DUF167 domain-containing protein [Alphaproteobacteria bacterium]